MPTADTDRYWQSIGQQNPYWGVLTNPTFLAENLTEDAIQTFYQTGEEHINFVLDVVRKHIDEDFAPASALDFGCGVGRLVIPLARRGLKVVGVDVSDGMLARARARCEVLGLSNVQLLHDAGELSFGPTHFDLIHSYIVFQHISCSRGQAIAERMLGRLSDGGVGVLHFTYFKGSPPRPPRLRRFIDRWRLTPVLRAIRGFGRGLVRLVTGRGWRTPEMQMNPYNLNPILLALQQACVRRVHAEFTDHGGIYGVLLFFQKRHDDRYAA